MPRTYGQTAYDVNQDALPVMGKGSRTPLDQVFASLDNSHDFPFRLRQSQPTADANLVIGANKIEFGDGTARSSAPADDTLQDYVETTVNFQTGALSGGTVTRDGSAFSIPTTTVGYFRRVAFVYQSQQNQVDCTFSAEVAALGSLADPGDLFALLDGEKIGYIDIEATAATAFKSAGSASNIIENKVGSDSRIINFGSGSGGGAGEITDLKFQSVSGNTLTIKKGYYKLSDGKYLYLASDLSYDLSGITVDGDYYGYVDLYTLPASSVVNGRTVYALTTNNWSFLTTTPEDINSSRYADIGSLQRSGGSWSNVNTAPVRVHNIALGSDASLQYQKEYLVVGDVGDSDQFKAGHELAAGSFPSGFSGSFYNLTNVTDNSGNGRNLTDNGSIAWNGSNILGVANAPVLNGSTQFLSSINAYFNPGDIDHSFGGWFKNNNWAAATGQALISNWNSSASQRSFLLEITPSGTLEVRASTDGNVSTATDVLNSSELDALTGWNHFACVYTATDNTYRFYLNGIYKASHTAAGNLYTSGSPKFNIGAFNDANDFWDGVVDEVFFVQAAYSQDQISKIYASRITHNANLSPQDQKWFGWGKADVERHIRNYIVDMDVNDLYVDFSDQLATTEVELKVYNGGAVGDTKPSKSKSITLTAAELDALLPLAHNMGMVPELLFKVKNASNKWEGHYWGNAFVVDGTNIELAGGTLTSLYGGSTMLMLTYSTGVPSQQVPDDTWNAYTVTADAPASAGDLIGVNTSGGVVRITFPENIPFGKQIWLVDPTGDWGTNDLEYIPSGSDTIDGVSGVHTYGVGYGVKKLMSMGNSDWRSI